MKGKNTGEKTEVLYKVKRFWKEAICSGNWNMDTPFKKKAYCPNIIEMSPKIIENYCVENIVKSQL